MFQVTTLAKVWWSGRTPRQEHPILSRVELVPVVGTARRIGPATGSAPKLREARLLSSLRSGFLLGIAG
jgi:hypothetical protein